MAGVPDAAVDDLRAGLAAALEAVGIPTTLDPAAVNVPVALVDIPHLAGRVTACRWSTTTDVWLIPAAAGGADAMAWVTARVLPAAFALAAPLGENAQYDRGGVLLPAYRFKVPSTVDYLRPEVTPS